MKKAITICIVFTLAVNMMFSQKKAPGLLDKKTFTCEFIEEGKKKATPVADDLKFTTGKFQCKMLLEEGFKATAYEATADSSVTPPSISFWADVPGDKDEVFKWTATINGEEIEGTATIYKKEKAKKSYTFTGTLKGKKPKK